MITYEEFKSRTQFSFQEILAYSYGNLISDPDPDHEIMKLPGPPFLMFDRITEVVRTPRSGRIVAEQDVKLDAWFFQCHFKGDPVQPGCLGLDAVWQLAAFWTSMMGGIGSGRALGVKEVAFNGQIRPHNKVVKYELFNMKYIRIPGQSQTLCDANVYVDNKLIYNIKGAKVGTVANISYNNYPWLGPNGEEK